MDYGKAIRRCMLNAGDTSWEAVERRTGVAAQHVSAYARGVKQPSGSTLTHLATCYGLTMPQFILLATEPSDLQNNLWVIDEFFAMILHNSLKYG